MAVWLSFNGAGLTSHAGYVLGYGSAPQPHPRPIEPGTVRFLFSNTDVQPYARKISNTGTWTQVYDSETGEPIPGMWDYAPGDYSTNFQGNLPPRNMSIEKCGGLVDIVDISLSGTIGNSSFFEDAFNGATSLNNVNIESMKSAVSCIGMFRNCANVRKANVLMETATTTETMFDNCTGLSKAYIRTNTGIKNMAFSGCTGLTDLTIEILNDGWFLFQNRHDDFTGAQYLRNITFIAPEYSTYTLHRSGLAGADQNTFEGLIYLESILTYERSIAYPEQLTQVPLPIGASGQKCFSSCTGLRGMPYLDVSHVTLAREMFMGCLNMESGIYDMYLALSDHISDSSQYRNCFRDCGSNTESGSAELAQIPAAWK